MYYILIKFFAFPKLFLDSLPPFTIHRFHFLSLKQTNEAGGKESQNRQTKEKKENKILSGRGQLAISFFFFFLNQKNGMRIPL